MTAKSPETERTTKIYLTMDKKIVRALEILAGDPRDKSKEIEKIIQEYIEFREDNLRKLGKYNRVLAALKGKTFDDSLENKMELIQSYVDENPENKKLSKIWLRAKLTMESDKIDLLYNKISQKIDNLEDNIDDILAN